MPNIKELKRKEFTIIDNFPFGYRNREDITILPRGILIPGSQNVLTNTAGRISVRNGYTLDGDADTSISSILATFDWQMHTGEERNLRAGFLTSAGDDGKLQYRYVYEDDTVEWIDLLTDLTSVAFNFTDYWDKTNLQAHLLMVNGASSIIEWSGGLAELESASANAILLEGNSASLTSYGSSTTSDISLEDNDYVGASLIALLMLDDNPAAGTTLTLTLNGTAIVIHFVSTIGAVAGNVLVGATMADTHTNLLGLLTNPGTTNSTQVALSGGNQTLVGYLTPSATATITKGGDETWAEIGFYPTGTHSVVTDGSDYEATGGWDMTTIYGVTPDPDVTIGAVIHQKPETTLNSAMTDIPATFTNDLIACMRNQVYVGSFSNNSVYISKVDDYTDYGFTATRAIGEGALITLDGTPKAFIPQEDRMYISGGLDQWYQTKFTLSSDMTLEDFSVVPFKTSVKQAAMSQALTTKVKNNVVFVSNEPVVSTLGRVENIFETPQITDISFPIINDMNSYDWTDASLKFYRNFLYVAIPVESIVLVYNMTNPKNMYWEAPQILPISRFSIIGGELYGHSYLTSETYKMFNGHNDNGAAIEAIAKFSYDNFGMPNVPKGFNEYYLEGYISSNTTLAVELNYDIDGFTTSAVYTVHNSNDEEILGSDRSIVAIGKDDNSLGKRALGKHPLGGDIKFGEVEALPPKFRVIKTFTRVPFYEYSISFSSNGIDQRWEILRFGPAMSPTLEGANAITI